MLIGIILGVFMLFLISLLFIPIYININTLSKQYYIELKGLVKASLVSYEAYDFQIRLRILGFDFYFDPLKKRPVKKTKISVSKKRSTSLRINKTIRLMKSFKVKQFFMDIDTGDCILNAKLYTLFALLNYKKTRFYINFEDRNQLILRVKNTPIQLLKSFINF